MDDVTAAPESKRPSPRRGSGRLRTLLRARVTAGLIIVLPVWVTVLLITFVFRLMRDASLWVVEGLLANDIARPLLERWNVTHEDLAGRGLDALPLGVQWGVGVFAVLVTIGLLYAIGLVSTNIIGKRLVHTAESVVDRLPIVKTVYRACKQVLETFTGEHAQNYQRVCLVPFPTDRVYSVGFITRVARDRDTGEELCSVFLATTPNPTTGYVLVLRKREVIELDWSVEDAIKVIISGGVMLPDQLPFIAGQRRAGQPDRPPVPLA